MPEGVVIRSLAGFFDVANQEEVRRCRARGVFRKRNVSVLVGDRVVYEPIGLTEGIVREVLPRRSELIRPPVANVDQALLVFSLAEPGFLPHLLDRLLVVVGAAGLDAVVVLTKIDLVEASTVEEVAGVYRNAGYEVCCTIPQQGVGLEAVLRQLDRRISVMAGPSGVGKSTLANALSPELGAKMGAVSEKLGRGKHTTRHVELFKLDDQSFVVDAPGFSQVEMDVSPPMLRTFFPEFAAHAADCAYRGCLHMDEGDCGVKRAAVRGEVNEVRYRSYTAFLNELREKEAHRY